MSNNRIAPGNCNHLGSIFIQAGSVVSTTEHSREHVSVCPKCGTFLVSIFKDGVHYSLTFQLVTDEAIQAAGQYLRGLDLDEPERTKPPGCTCAYPELVARNMNGHDSTCPVYIEWAKEVYGR